jgi:hypothetical protein
MLGIGSIVRFAFGLCGSAKARADSPDEQSLHPLYMWRPECQAVGRILCISFLLEKFLFRFVQGAHKSWIDGSGKPACLGVAGLAPPSSQWLRRKHFDGSIRFHCLVCLVRPASRSDVFSPKRESGPRCQTGTCCGYSDLPRTRRSGCLISP